MLWYIPTFHGDISLAPEPGERCRIIVSNATPSERKALAALTTLAQRKGWLDKQVALDQDTVQVLAAPLSKVQKFLAKELKPGRKLVSAVRFTNGKMQEVTDVELAAIDKPPDLYRDANAPESEAPAPLDKPKPEAATTVAKPVRGCPAPDFAAAELRATQVLRAFLDPQQLQDFERYNGFVTRGTDTGHHYMLTSRHARGRLQRYARSVYDMDEQRAYCVHDWTIPAAEELLTFHVLLSLPDRENYLREIPDEGPRVFRCRIPE